MNLRLLTPQQIEDYYSKIMDKGRIKKGLSAGKRVSCSVYSVERKLHLMHYYFWTLPS